MEAPWVWVVATLGAALLQTVRNAAQAGLTGRLGPLGATGVRFLFGLPFALAGLGLVAATGQWPGLPGAAFWVWVGVAAAAQIGATALMLAAMQGQGFVVVIAFTRTELLQTALLGVLILGDPLPTGLIAAVLVAGAGVMLASLPGQAIGGAGLRPVLLGVASGAVFSVGSICYRGAALSVEAAPLVQASVTLAAALGLQALAVVAWLALRAPGRMLLIARAWRPSLLAGAAGASASYLWFLAFALASAAEVRLVGLVEIPFAWVVSARIFRERLSPAEIAGVLAIAAGIAILLTP